MSDTGRETTVHETDTPAPGPSAVTVRYWAAARAAAGRVEDAVDGAETVQQVLDAAVGLHGGDDRFARVLAISSILLGDRPVRREDLSTVSVNDGDVVEVLPPFAGG